MKQMHVAIGLLLVLVALGLFLKHQRENMGVVDKATDEVGDFFSGMTETLSEFF